MSPFGAMARPSSPFSAPPAETVVPVPSSLSRSTALGMAAILLLSVSATYRVPFAAEADAGRAR